MAGLFYYSSPLGFLKINIEDAHITLLEFVKDGAEPVVVSKKKNQLYNECAGQLDRYFDGKLTRFSLPLKLQGTEFQRSVWRELTNIPYGTTISYADLAQRIGNPRSTRAVGAANGQNPVSLILPCHRVIGKNGQLTGYGGGLWRKQWLLEHEAKVLNPRYPGSVQLSLFTQK